MVVRHVGTSDLVQTYSTYGETEVDRAKLPEVPMVIWPESCLWDAWDLLTSTSN